MTTSTTSEETKWFTNRAPDRSKRHVKKGGEISSENIVQTRTRRAGLKTVDYKALATQQRVIHSMDDKQNMSDMTDKMDNLLLMKNKGPVTRNRISLSKKIEQEVEEEEEKIPVRTRRKSLKESPPLKPEITERLLELGAKYIPVKNRTYWDSSLPLNLKTLCEYRFDKTEPQITLKSEEHNLRDLLLCDFILSEKELDNLPFPKRERKKILLFGEDKEGHILLTKFSEKGKDDINVWILDNEDNIGEPILLSEFVQTLEVDEEAMAAGEE